MPRNFTEIFYEPEGTSWALVALGGSPEEGTTHQGTPGGLGAPWWVLLPSSHPRGAFLAHWMSSGQKNPPGVSLCLDSV